MMVLALICLALAVVPGTLLFLNLFRYRPAPATRADAEPAISVLIPARNEESNIGACLASVLANRNVHLEVLVLDDHSEDRTAEIVRSWQQRDPRVRLVRSTQLPEGWCGKQFACHQLSREASHPHFAFIDADVRLGPDALSRAWAFLERSRSALVSGVPWQETRTFSEKLLIPLIHFVLLAYLPFGMMRRFRSAAFAAGCGQFFLVQAEAYRQAGGHKAVAASAHDGLMLPRSFRKAGFRTDLFDATDVAQCRMYPSGGEVWRGLTKNAVEGIARPTLLLPFTAFFLFGQILPPFLAISLMMLGATGPVVLLLAVASLFSWATRLACAWRFRQSWLGALLHPLAIASFLAIQWRAAFLELRGRPFYWKGRPQPRGCPVAS